MATLHKVVASHTRSAEKNARRDDKQVRAKIGDILERAGISSSDISSKVNEVYNLKLKEMASLAHISINTPGDRVLALVDDGRLSPSRPRDIYSKMFRENAENCFRGTSSESPIYGALNINSLNGAAPGYCPDMWLRLAGKDIAHMTTFTARDSYNITLPFLGGFNTVSGQEAIQREIYTWENVGTFFLNRFWGWQDKTCYVEAQLWGPVRLKHIESFHVHTSFKKAFETELSKCRDPLSVKYVKDRLQVFS